MKYRAVLVKKDKSIGYNHGDGRGLVSDPWDSLAIPAGEETDLYRHFDAEGTLLYVGISLSAVSRLSQHVKATYDWTKDIKTVTIEKFDSRPSALRAERNAIKTEKPLYNKNHNK